MWHVAVTPGKPINHPDWTAEMGLPRRCLEETNSSTHYGWFIDVYLEQCRPPLAMYGAS